MLIFIKEIFKKKQKKTKAVASRLKQAGATEEQPVETVEGVEGVPGSSSRLYLNFSLALGPWGSTVQACTDLPSGQKLRVQCRKSKARE